jgi:hypothetical protein
MRSARRIRAELAARVAREVLDLQARLRLDRDTTAPSRRSDLDTAPRRICSEPTLSRGSAVTAYEVPRDLCASEEGARA